VIVSKPGTWTLQLNVVGGDKFGGKTTYVLSAQPIPYLEVKIPECWGQVPVGQSLTIKASLMKSGKQVDPSGFFDTPSNSLVLAGFVQNPGEKRQRAIWLTPSVSNPGVFEGRLPAEDQEGSKVIEVKLTQGLGSQGAASNPEFVFFDIKPTLFQKAAIIGKWALLGMAITILSLVILSVLWIATRKKMDGYLEITQQPSGEDDEAVVIVPLSSTSQNLTGRRMVSVKLSAGKRGQLVLLTAGKAPYSLAIYTVNRVSIRKRILLQEQDINIGPCLVRYA
jgi:hypothetical protein